MPPLLLAPWLALNVDRYGSPTVDATGSPGVVGSVEGARRARPRCGDLPTWAEHLLDGVLPQEWILPARRLVGPARRRRARARAAGRGASRRSCVGRRDWRIWFLALPAIGGLGLLVAVYLFTGSLEIFLLRYVYPALPPLALAAGIGLARGGVTRVHVAGLLAVTLLLGALWVDLAGFFWFNNVGAKLGI